MILTTRNCIGGKPTVRNAKLFDFKEAGVEAHKSISKTFEYTLPVVRCDDFRKSNDPLPGSWQGHVFGVAYVLNVYTKHDYWHATGQGDKQSLPIRVFNTARLCQADEPYRVPQDWAPIADGFDPVYLYHQE